MADAPRPLLTAAACVVLLVAPLISFLGDVERSDHEPRPNVGYRVAYLIEDRAGERPTARTEIVEVKRPYGGRIESRPGRPPGGDISSGRVSNREFGWQLDDNGKPQFGLRRPSGGPTRDISFAALRDAARAGVIEMGPQGSAVGHRCTWFFFADPFPEPLAPPTFASRVEACVDPTGPLLREVWTISGKVARIVEAVGVDPTPPRGERFLEGRTPDPKDVTQPEAMDVVRQQIVVGDDVGGMQPALRLSVPDGWEADRDAQVVQAAATGRATQYTSRTFLRGNQLVVVEVGLRAEHQPTWQWTEGESFDVPEASKARVMFFGDHVELRVLYDEGFARINAPTRSIAVAFARRS